MGIKYVFISVALIISFSSSFSQQKILSKVLEDQTNFTNIGKIGLTISNYGLYGNGLINLNQQNHPPSCEYPLGSGIEHIYAGGLWVGGFIKNSLNSNLKYGPYVTTAAVDVSSLSRGGGFEFTNAPGSHITQRSSLLDSPFYDPAAISHQDFIMDYDDTRLTTDNGTFIVDHNPLGIAVHEEDYAWNFPFADFFVIKNFTIKNVSGNYLDSVYVGLYTDAVVRNTKITTVTNSAFFSHTAIGYDDSLNLSYCFDSDGDIGFTDSYIGVLYLGSTPGIDSLFFQPNALGGIDTLPSTSYCAWQWNSTTGSTDLFAPQTDLQRYTKMQGYFQYPLRFKDGFSSRLKVPSNRPELITHGYFKNIAPGDSINVVYAIVCGKKFGIDPAALDSRTQRNILYNNADWALRTYYGNDRNRNGILDPGEDDYGDARIHRYIFYPLILTSPIGGERCLAGHPRYITWASTIADNVKIEYSTNNGADWITITLGTPANTGSYSWLVPATPSTSCRVRITSITYPELFSVSTDVFTISTTNNPPSISWDILSTLPDSSLPVMSFGWNASDLDGTDNLAGIRIALNDTNNFVQLGPKISQVLLKTNNFSDPDPIMDIFSGSDSSHILPQKLSGLKLNANNLLYLQAVDLTGAVSPWISTQIQSPSHNWFVKKPKGKYLIIDDYSAYGDPAPWYSAMMDSIQLSNQFDVLDIAHQKLPYLNATFLETVKLFDYLLWYSDNLPSLNLAGLTLPQFTSLGGKAFLSWLFPQTLDLTQVQGFLPISSDNSSYLSMLTPGKIVSDTSHSGYPNLKVTESFVRVRAFFVNPGVKPIYYFPNKELSGYIGFESSNNNLFFIGMPLDKINAIPGSVNNLLQKVFLNDFNTPFIRLNSPVPGEALQVGESYKLLWNCNKVSNVKIDYSTDSGTSWTIVTSGVDGASGSYMWTVPNTPSGNCQLKISDVSNPSVFSIINFSITLTSGINDNGRLFTYELMQNYPNPFNPSTFIRFTLPFESKVKLLVINILGQVVKELDNSIRDKGYYEINFNPNDISSGVYFYTLSAGSLDGKNEFRSIKKMLYLK